MHFQVFPHPEAKLVSSTQGAFHDVLIDVRPDSATYMISERDANYPNYSTDLLK